MLSTRPSLFWLTTILLWLMTGEPARPQPAEAESQQLIRSSTGSPRPRPEPRSSRCGSRSGAPAAPTSGPATPTAPASTPPIGWLGAISGTVTDAVTGQPITEGRVEVYDAGGSYAGDGYLYSAGSYTIEAYGEEA